MAYQVKFTEDTNPAKPSLTVDDQTLNAETSLKFVGKNYAGYAPVVAENFLHLLENFAKNSEPSNPIEGQLWYDNSAGVNLLKVYDGTTWNPAGSVKKADDQPSVSNSTKGDLWVDTANQQLYIFSGSGWLLVGPQFSSGLKTGPQVETIVDTDNVDRNVLTLYSDNYRIAIVSKASFTPKAVVTGFSKINQGITISSTDATNTSAPTKFHGTASQADALMINNVAINATNFLRSDQPSTANYPISIRSAGGISIGSDLNFNIGTDGNTTVLYSKTSGNSVDIKLSSSGIPGIDNGTPTTIIHVDASAKVGIGPNNTSPQEALDVLGSIQTSGKITVTGSLDSTVLGGAASITTNGGLNVDKKSHFGDDMSTYGVLYVNQLDAGGDPLDGAAAILPGPVGVSTNDANGKYDIGSATRKFKNVYANSFVGSFNGSFTGALTGNISGSAAKLASATNFSLTGDVSSNTIAFDGQGDDPSVFTTTITQDVIAGKTLATDSFVTDQILLYRPGTGLRKITKQTFVSNIPTVPVGAIFPFAGLTIPNGYLLCDGAEVSVGRYLELFGVIGYTYKTPSLLLGANTFALPDLRGRFALGRDNMENVDPNTGAPFQVIDKTDPTVLIDAGGGSANRVTDVVADTIGAGSGTEYKSLVVANLPEHKHNLNSGLAQYYAGGLPAATSDPNGVPNRGLPDTSTGLGLPNSGGVDSATHSVPFGTMNPYLTINYIIFTGATA